MLLAVATGSAGTAVAANKVVYSCQGGTGFNATFDNAADRLILELQGGAQVVLQPAVTGSGMRYVGGGYEFRGKGPDATLTGPGQPERVCQEIGRIGATPAAPAAATASPSFNCGGRLNATERRICSNATLASLDRTMAATYSGLLGRMGSTAQRSTLSNDQRNWLRQRNACGSSDQCIEGQIAERIGYLNEYLQPASPPPAQTGGGGFPIAAQSWGGIVRSGPGQNFPKIASLREGEPITILEQTGAYFQGRPWFKIRYRGRTGYHWGGIICPKGRAVPGTFQVCN